MIILPRTYATVPFFQELASIQILKVNINSQLAITVKLLLKL